MMYMFPIYCFIFIVLTGVQEAFFCTPSVFTLSFHKYGDGFFPGGIAIPLRFYEMYKLFNLNSVLIVSNSM